MSLGQPISRPINHQSRFTHRKRKKGNWMSFKPRALHLKIGYLRGIKLQCARWKNSLMTNVLGWELFSGGVSAAGPLGQCILQNFLNVVRAINVHIGLKSATMYNITILMTENVPQLSLSELLFFLLSTTKCTFSGVNYNFLYQLSILWMCLILCSQGFVVYLWSYFLVSIYK